MNTTKLSLITKREQLQTMLTILYNEAYIVEPLLADAIMEVMNFKCSFEDELEKIQDEEWVEEILETRSWEVVECCERDNEQAYNAFICELQKLKGFIPNDCISSLENLFVSKFYGYRVAYKAGANDRKEIEHVRKRLVYKRPTQK
ncbi:hypothetical protein M5X04_14815 [Paenibacillus alvei]|uniref:Uncharacterized protein n=1 Tax=Paenibacillus alvei TaxID=44250 RepID=A0ABT4EAD7_PAEAL|nr:hypothetical protein [Paenibacillus alvei]MCY9530590.1 hypothetical protein [Paenibacillus alvei]